ncbi:MAG: hypothetical protein ACREB2_07745 [Pseudolabrys sp.]
MLWFQRRNMTKGQAAVPKIAVLQGNQASWLLDFRKQPMTLGLRVQG